jgi:hypothetical protein
VEEFVWGPGGSSEGLSPRVGKMLWGGSFVQSYRPRKAPDHCPNYLRESTAELGDSEEGCLRRVRGIERYFRSLRDIDLRAISANGLERRLVGGP